MNILLRIYPRLNLGDDLFLKIICERYPKVTFHLLADDKYKNLGDWNNLEVYSGNYNNSLFAKLRRFIYRKFFPSLFRRELQDVYEERNREQLNNVDAFVSIGGSIFMERYDNLFRDPEIAYYKLINAIMHNKPKIYIGCNFGPYSTNNYLEEYKKIFEEVEDICFRDKYSYDLFKDVKSVRLAPDVVFGMDVNKQQKESNSVGFSIVSARNGINEASYYKKYARLIENYQSRGFSVYLFSFCKGEGDEDAIERIISLIRSTNNINSIYYNGNIDDYLGHYSKMEYMYCGRFHAMILSMLYGQKIFPVIYSKKMTNVLEDIEYKGKYIDISEFENLNIKEAISQIDNNYYNIDNQKINAIKQFQVLDFYSKK